MGDITPTHYEIVYIDNILENEGWETITDLEKVFPNFISLKGQNLPSTDIREFSWQMLFRICQMTLGYYNCQFVTLAYDPLTTGIFSVLNSRRLATNPISRCEVGLIVPMKLIFDLFSNLISDEIQVKYWGRKTC